MELYRENFRNLLVPNHKAYGYQILHVALSSGPSPRGVNYNPRVELIARVTSFTLAYIVKSCEIFLLLKIRTTNFSPCKGSFTNFSPCKGSYVLNQFPSNVMFGMNGFHVSASGAIQGHHGPLVLEHMTKIQMHFFFCSQLGFLTLRLCSNWKVEQMAN